MKIIISNSHYVEKKKEKNSSLEAANNDQKQVWTGKKISTIVNFYAEE